MTSGMMLIPPHDIEAEQIVLGQILHAIIVEDARAKAIARKILASSDFYREAHQLIFEALLNSGSFHETCSYLEKKDLLDRVGGSDYITHLGAGVSTSAGIKYFCDIIKDKSLSRQVISAATEVIEAARSGHKTSEELISQLNSSLVKIDTQDHFGFKPGVDIDNVFDAKRMLESYRVYISNISKNRFITSIHEIDKRIRGVAGGEVLTVIARAGSFKTAFLQNMLKSYIQASTWGALFFSLEMPVASLTERYHEIVGGITAKTVEEYYTSEEAQTFREDMEIDYIKSLNGLYVVPTKVSIKEMMAYVKLIEKRFQQKIGVVGIDYLGLIDGEGKGEYEIISNLSRDIKTFAKVIDLPVILLSQTNRQAGTGTNEVSLSMGRGSGAIEEAADFVLGMWQDEDDLICKILKNRKGSKGSCWKFNIDPRTLRIGREAERKDVKTIQERKDIDL